MIDLHYWPTPNGHKITLFLEETGLPYRIVPVDIGRGEQFTPEFLAIAPNNRMPAIVDHEPADGGEPVSLFESGAILLYLAEKTGRFIPDRPARPGRGAAVAVLADGRPRADGRAEPPLRRSTRPSGCPTPSTATSTRPTGSTACSTAGWPIAPSSRATTTRSPTWPPIPGSSRTRTRARSSATSRIWSAGSAPSRPGRRPCAPTRSARSTAPRCHGRRGGEEDSVRPDRGHVAPLRQGERACRWPPASAGLPASGRASRRCRAGGVAGRGAGRRRDRRLVPADHAALGPADVGRHVQSRPARLGRRPRRLPLPAAASGQRPALAADAAVAARAVGRCRRLSAPARGLPRQSLRAGCQDGPAPGSRRGRPRRTGRLGLARRRRPVSPRRHGPHRPDALAASCAAAMSWCSAGRRGCASMASTACCRPSRSLCRVAAASTSRCAG